MIDWNVITTPEQLAAISEKENNFLIFKHSTSCSISAMAKSRFERDWNESLTNAKPYLVDLLKHRSVSNAVSEKFCVHHESPQILLIHSSECVYDASHLDISFTELIENAKVH